MLERQRQQYLSVFGIDNYMPRRILPGAAPSALLASELLQPLVDDSPEKQLNQQQFSSVPKAESIEQADSDVAANLSEMLSTPLDALPLDVLKQSEAPTIEQVDAGDGVVETTLDQQKEVRFVLTVWRIVDYCLVIDSRQPGAALPTDRLLQNILRAIGYPLAQLPPSELIRWPLFSQVSADESQARAMVHAYISAQEIKAPIKHLLLMGEPAACFSLGSNTKFSALNGCLVETSPWQATTVVIPSLVTMLQEPLQKGIAWKALQQLIV